VTGADLNRAQYAADYYGDPDEYPGFTHAGWLYGDPGIGVPQVVALRALDGNVAAAYTYTSRGRANIDALVHPEGLPVPLEPRIYDEVTALYEEVDRHAAGAIQNAFLKAQYETVPDPAHPGQTLPLIDPAKDTAAYNDFMASVAKGDTSDLMKRAAASTLLPHLDEIAAAANEQAERLGDDPNGLFQRQNVVGFFNELGYDNEATAIAGESIGVWSATETKLLFAADPHPTPGQLQDTYDPIAQVVGAAYQGLDENEAAQKLAASHLSWGIAHGRYLVADLAPVTTAILLGGAALTVPQAAAVAVTIDVLGHAGLFGIEELRDHPPTLPYDGDDLQREVVTNLRAQAVHELETGGHIAAGTQPGHYSGVLADYFGGTDPYDELDQSSFVNAFRHSADDPW